MGGSALLAGPAGRRLRFRAPRAPGPQVRSPGSWARPSLPAPPYLLSLRAPDTAGSAPPRVLFTCKWSRFPRRRSRGEVEEMAPIPSAHFLLRPSGPSAGSDPGGAHPRGVRRRDQRGPEPSAELGAEPGASRHVPQPSPATVGYGDPRLGSRGRRPPFGPAHPQWTGRVSCAVVLGLQRTVNGRLPGTGRLGIPSLGRCGGLPQNPHPG